MENTQKPNERKDIKTAYRTAYLIAGFLKQTLTGDEKEELDAWILASDENMILFEKMTDEKNLEQAADWFKEMNIEEELQATKSKIRQRKTIPLWTYAITAAIVVLIIAGIYLYQSNQSNNNNQAIANNQQDIKPGSNMATLTLDDGHKIVLYASGTDTTINNKIRLLRKNGELVYSNNSVTKELVYNTLTVPRKGRYKVVLPDGTKVSLNAESSIRYPVAFVGKERKVFVSGEAYFEVAKNKDKPFRVVINNVMLEDLGTQFNVNAYANEPYFAATLVEGSVRLTKDSVTKILEPGQQAQLMNNRINVMNIDVDGVTAWKDNMFKFHGTSLDEIMRQVERWYDADVEFKNGINLHLNATIKRDVPVSKLLQILEETGQVHFTIENKKITVMK